MVVFNDDIYRVTNTENYDEIFDIDEIEGNNKELCKNISRSIGCFDINNNQKYYVSGGELYEREGWEQYVDPLAL